MKKQNKTADRNEAMRIALWIFAALGVGLCLLNLPHKTDEAQSRAQTKALETQIVKVKKHAQKASPLNKENKIDLVQAEKQAQENLSSGVSLVFGGMQNQAAYSANRASLQKKLGKKFTKFYASEPAGYTKNDFTKVYFSKVNDIHHAKILVVTQYEFKAMGKQQTNSIGFVFDYDLTKQKVNSYQNKNFFSDEVLDKGDSNL